MIVCANKSTCIHGTWYVESPFQTGGVLVVFSAFCFPTQAMCTGRKYK